MSGKNNASLRHNAWGFDESKALQGGSRGGFCTVVCGIVARAEFDHDVADVRELPGDRLRLGICSPADGNGHDPGRGSGWQEAPLGVPSLLCRGEVVARRIGTGYL